MKSDVTIIKDALTTAFFKKREELKWIANWNRKHPEDLKMTCLELEYRADLAAIDKVRQSFGSVSLMKRTSYCIEDGIRRIHTY